MLKTNEIYLGDCLEVMRDIDDKSIDMILCDLPYGTTTCKWDNIIPFKPLWEQFERIIKDNGAIVLFGSQPFTGKLILSNAKLFKYELIWRKTRINGFAQAPYKFMNEHENILIFSKAGCAKNAKPRMKYNAQDLIYSPKIERGKRANNSQHRIARIDQKDYIQEWTNYPKSILEFKSEYKISHPTQKPVTLCEYLIKTYTNQGEVVLDNCLGSGTTAIACINTNRNYIGIELDEGYFNIAKKRIQDYKI